MARHAITLIGVDGDPDTGATVELFTPLESASPWFQTPQIGVFSNNGDGTYHIDIVNTILGTVLVNGVAVTAWRNRQFLGDSVGSGGGEIADGSVTTAKLADNAVTTAKLADNSVTSAKIVDGTITPNDANFVEPY